MAVAVEEHVGVAAVVEGADAEWAETTRIAGCHQLRRRHDRQRVRTLELRHRALDGNLDRWRFETLVGDDIRDHLGVDRGVEDRPRGLEFVPQLVGIHEVAVVRERHGALEMVDDERLRIRALAAARGAVADVAERKLASAERVKLLGGEHVTHQARVTVVRKHPVVVHNDAAGLLAAMLQRVQPVIAVARNISGVRADDAEDTAFLMDSLELGSHAPTAPQ